MYFYIKKKKQETYRYVNSYLLIIKIDCTHQSLPINQSINQSMNIVINIDYIFLVLRKG